MKSIEQVIMDASKEWCAAEGLSVEPGEAVAIAEAVRGWMRDQNEGLRDTIYNLLMNNLPPQALSLEDCRKYTDAILSVIPPRRVQSAPDRARIKELEAESKVWGIADPHVQEWRDKAAKYDELRAKFPLHPGEVFYVLYNGKIWRKTVWAVYSGGVIDNEKRAAWSLREHHPTADACRAAIPVEE